MKSINTLIHARWVVPIVPEHTVLEKHSVVIESGKILDILPTVDAKVAYQAKAENTRDQHVLMPGLINAHTHSPMALFRGMADDLPLMTWLKEHIWPIEGRYLNEEFVRDGTKLAMGEMIRSGTTCFNEHYFFPNVIAAVAQQVGLRARIGVVLIDAKTAWAGDVDACLEKGLVVARAYKNNSLIQFSLAPHAPYTLSDVSLLKMKAYALPIHMHVHETATEVEESLKKHQKRPLKRLYDLGLLSDHFQAVHMTQTVDEDIALLKETGAHVIHCPSSNLKLASGFCPVQRLLDENVNVALGTDGAASNNNLDLFQAIYLAALIGKTVDSDATAVVAMDVLKMATINGAKALGLSDKIGSIEKGKSADLIAIDMNHFNTQPLFNPISDLAYSVNSMQVSDVWVEGKVLLENSELTTLNKREILEKSGDWKERFNKI